MIFVLLHIVADFALTRENVLEGGSSSPGVNLSNDLRSLMSWACVTFIIYLFVVQIQVDSNSDDKTITDYKL